MKGLLCIVFEGEAIEIEKGIIKPGVDLAKKIGRVLNFDWTLFYEEEKGA